MSGRQVRSPSIEVEANYWSLLYQVKGLRNPHKSILYVYIISINFKLVIGIFYSIQPKYDHVSKTVGKIYTDMKHQGVWKKKENRKMKKRKIGRWKKKVHKSLPRSNRLKKNTKISYESTLDMQSSISSIIYLKNSYNLL